jgi:hypothetical protein
MVYFLPNEFMAPANQVVQEETSLDINDDEQLGGLMAQLVLAKQATFDKPAKNRHMRPLYLKGYVNGNPLTKMFVNGGAAVNVMPYTTFKKLGMCPGDLTPTVGEFRKTRHPRNIKYDKVLETCFSGAGNSRFSEAWNL